MTFRHNTDIGQNFLADKSIADWMVARANLDAGSRVLEIGPGSGALTKAILASGCSRVDAIETDKRLREYLEPIAASDPRLVIHWADAVKFGYSELPCPPTHVIANLPYHITTPVIWRLLEECPAVGTNYMIVMTQAESAERLACGAGVRESNPMSITIAAIGSASAVRKVPRTAFRPAPRVDSAIVEILLDAPPPRLALPGDARWRRLLSGSFASRRKTLANNWRVSFRMGKDGCAETLSRRSLGAMARPEELTLDDWLALYSDWRA